jgi:hypothetical protein
MTRSEETKELRWATGCIIFRNSHTPPRIEAGTEVMMVKE